jgi:8-oxo-dGTP pyrophosphatase MutT (NUDIX family)
LPNRAAWHKDHYVPPEPLRCAGALIVDDEGRIFVQRRSPDRRLFPNCWDIVGGHLMDGESVDEAVRREVEEETGWRISVVLGQVGEFTYTGDDERERVERDFLVRVDGDLNRPRLEQGKHTEWRWLAEADLDSLDKNGAGDELVREILTAGFETVRTFGFV